MVAVLVVVVVLGRSHKLGRICKACTATIYMERKGNCTLVVVWEVQLLEVQLLEGLRLEEVRCLLEHLLVQVVGLLVVHYHYRHYRHNWGNHLHHLRSIDHSAQGHADVPDMLVAIGGGSSTLYE